MRANIVAGAALEQAPFTPISLSPPPPHQHNPLTGSGEIQPLALGLSVGFFGAVAARTIATLVNRNVSMVGRARACVSLRARACLLVRVRACARLCSSNIS